MVERGRDPGDYAETIFRACWTEERDIADPGVLAEKLALHGEDPDAILAAAADDAIERLYAGNSAEAVRLGALGSPTYVLNGENFWGQDRLDMLEEALSSRRPPYRCGPGF
jgi:2-hydroxychromene-2-carboxylate isomerase